MLAQEMPRAPLTRLGPYEIVSRLGAGAMGEVYRARDSRLGRDVAIKILPADVSADPGRRARFEQEARAVAALNHPNILGLYDIGNEDGVSYIVTEFVAGETLAALLERGPLPMRKLLDIAVQIADGMAAAHAARITHRDLKPLNIMVGGPASGTLGRVRILDFGLAKQAVVSTDPDETQIAGHTQPGMILGTVNDMSPEQARGAPTDYRSDQFSFGLILYEMAAGKRAFDRPESVQTMSAIIGEEAPPVEQNIPAPLRWTIERCLAKDPADRYESSRDLFQGLRSLRDHASDASMARPAAADVDGSAAGLSAAVSSRARRRLPWPLAAAFAAGLAAALAIHALRTGPPMPDQSAYRFTPFSLAPGGQHSALWSPAGDWILLGESLYSPDGKTVHPLGGHRSDAYVFAPDGKRVYGLRPNGDGEELFTVDIASGAEKVVGNVGQENRPSSNLNPAIRLSLAPDGKSVAYGIGKFKDNLWMLEGFAVKAGLWKRLGF